MARKAVAKKGSSGKIAAFVASYTNKSTGSGYKTALESFLRCMNSLPKKNADDRRILMTMKRCSISTLVTNHAIMTLILRNLLNV